MTCWGRKAVSGALGNRTRAAASDLALNILALHLPLPEDVEPRARALLSEVDVSGPHAGEFPSPAAVAVKSAGRQAPEAVAWLENWDGSRVTELASRLHMAFRDEVLAAMPETGGTVSAADVQQWILGKLRHQAD